MHNSYLSSRCILLVEHIAYSIPLSKDSQIQRFAIETNNYIWYKHASHLSRHI